MKRADFVDWLTEAMNEYDDDRDLVEVASVIPGDHSSDDDAVGVALRDGTRFILTIEAVDESDYATGHREDDR